MAFSENVDHGFIPIDRELDEGPSDDPMEVIVATFGWRCPNCYSLGCPGC